jgi:hypothetical protein
MTAELLLEHDDHIQGWMDCLDRLPAWLASGRG